jgi:hypothetical protein
MITLFKSRLEKDSPQLQTFGLQVGAVCCDIKTLQTHILFMGKNLDGILEFHTYCSAIGLSLYVKKETYFAHRRVAFQSLVALRILGRNNSADDTNELSGGVIGESTCNAIFKVFVTKISKLLYHEYVKEPEGPELQRVMEGYRLLGLPGAIGSMDVTHVRWERCPRELVWSCTEKEAHPTLALIITVEFITSAFHFSAAQTTKLLQRMTAFHCVLLVENIGMWSMFFMMKREFRDFARVST